MRKDQRASKRKCPWCKNMAKINVGNGRLLKHDRYFGGVSVQCQGSGKIWYKN